MPSLAVRLFKYFLIITQRGFHSFPRTFLYDRRPFILCPMIDQGFPLSYIMGDCVTIK